MKRLLSFFLIITIVFLCAFICGCMGSTTVVTGITVKIADTTGDWGFPSPYRHNLRGPGYVRMSMIFDTLVWKDDKGIVPALAEKWEYIEDENAFVFNLRKGVKWHDGEAFDAQDVLFTVEYTKKHPYAMVDSTIIKRRKQQTPIRLSFI